MQFTVLSTVAKLSSYLETDEEGQVVVKEPHDLLD